MNKKINKKALSTSREIPTLFKIRYKKIFNKKIKKHLKRVLIIDTCIIGDFLATLPALAKYITENNLECDIIVSSAVKRLAGKIHGIKRVFTASPSDNKEKSMQSLSKEYDKIIILRISPEAYNLMKKIKYGEICTYDTHLFRYLFHIAKNLAMKKKLRQSRQFNFDILGLKESYLPFNKIFDFSEKDYQKIKKMPEMKGKERKIIINTGSKWFPYLWSSEKWIELIKKINKLGKFRFIFVGGTKNEEKDFRFIQDALDFKVYSLIGNNLEELLLIMKLSDYFIGIDSGPRNLANLADLRSVCLYGPGLKNFMPLSSKDVVIDKSDCNFCTSFTCFKKGKCMQNIKVNDVYNGFKKLLESK